ncbi:hypothetical protein TOPH_01768 [Tolypocladium ophioglossoides CBS 100239]|uniref:DNA-directed RNA polymerase III subunit rpc4 n=1 Tax=Tolypocladium ophioglossoides (strain CBS 100239) TaxID=1163406 RepID=A0A0L0NH54_TOLOC|nr:hypothetical protein TOPH_01768 [Tolypocladium ophioglossoides CBS 100239]
MVRGRATVRGGRRGAAAAGTQRAAAASTDEAGSAAPAELTAAASDSAGAPSTATRRGTTTRATRAPSTGRFRPKAVRRDEADRDTLARLEEKKASERAAEERRARGHSRYRSKRSRGDAMGSRGGWGRGTSTASGPFSGGLAGSSGKAGGWFGGGGPGGGGFSGGGGRSSRSDSKGFSQADASRMREARINADKLHVMTPGEELDSDDEAMMAALSNRTSSAMPMGIYRREHKETGIVVATTAELEAAEKANGDEESLWVDGEGAVLPAEQPEEQGVWDTKAGKKVQIKKEPGTDDLMDLDADIKSSPGKEKKFALVTNPKKEIPQDPENKTIQADMNLLASELGAVTVTEDGETKTEGPADKDGRMYLFQFPPLIPPIKQVAAPQPKLKVKEEPKAFNMLDAVPSTGDAAPVDLTQQDASWQATAEEEEEEEEEEERDGFRSQLLAQGGMIGKLNVRKSGKVELDWGGMTLEMSPAAGMNFLTTAVIVEENDEKPQHGVVGGDSIGMGKIMGRFVLAPVWNDEEEWNVAPEELIAG